MTALPADEYVQAALPRVAGLPSGTVLDNTLRLRHRSRAG